jgi:Helix-turn-helix domain
MHPRTLVLTPAQYAELVWTRDHDRRAYLRERAAALLKVAAGQTAHHVARHGLHKPRDPDTLYRWLDVYAQDGLAGLVHRPRRSRGLDP